MTENAELCAALVAAQAEMPAVEPNATNPHFKSKFVSLDHLIARTRPVLNRHGLAIIQAPAHLDGAPALATTVLHTSGQSLTSMVPLILGKQDMQGLGAAITYARRYAWAAALGIASEEDDDGEQAVSRQRDEPEEPAEKGGARGWDHLWDLLGECGIPREDAEVWVRQAAKEAHGLESLKDASPDERRLVFRQANDALMLLVGYGVDFAFADDARALIREAFAMAFGGAMLEGPAWRISPAETERPTRYEAESTSEA